MKEYIIITIDKNEKRDETIIAETQINMKKEIAKIINDPEKRTKAIIIRELK
nr:MAG: hypothetical protein [Microviridae sp.]